MCTPCEIPHSFRVHDCSLLLRLLLLWFNKINDVKRTQVASRWNTTVEGAIEVEKGLQFDRAIYDELRERRDYGFEQVKHEA